MEISIPTLHDSGLAPDGKHVLSAVVQYAPFKLRAGWESGRDAFRQLLIEQLEQYAPGIGGQVSGAELLAPPDLEKEFNMHGGHWHHGELSLDQFMMLRPVPGAAPTPRRSRACTCAAPAATRAAASRACPAIMPPGRY